MNHTGLERAALLLPGICLLAWLLGGCGVSREEPRRNVLLITIDTLRADHLGCYGYPLATSPNIDRLARDSVRFADVVSSSAYTAPSVASIMTGRYPRFNSLGYSNRNARVVDSEVTLAEHFQDAGYETAAFICNPVLRRRKGLHQGFDLYDVTMEGREAVRDKVERIASDCTDAVVEWLDDPREEPFFLWVHYQDPHGPYTPPGDFSNRFQSPEKGPPIRSPREGDDTGYGRVPWYQAIDEDHFLHVYRDRYDEEIAYMDHHLGRMLDHLRTTGRYDDAVILLTADHGEAFGENGFYFVHGMTVTRDQSFVPLILKHPDLARGTETSVPAGHVDILPTLTSELGRPPRPGVESGIDLVSMLSGPPPDRPLFCDIGGRLGVYGEGALMIGGLRSQTDQDILALRPGDFKPISFSRYRDDGSRNTGLQRRLMEHARRYLDQAPAEFGSLKPDPDHDAELRALGYVVD